MAADGAGPRRVFQAFDLLVVVVTAVVGVSAGGVLWSYLRVGSVRPAYVREAQFLAGLVVLLAWVVRNRVGRGLRSERDGEAGDGSTAFAAWRVRAFRRLAGEESATVGAALGTDAYLLALGLALLVLSLGGEVVGVPAG